MSHQKECPKCGHNEARKNGFRKTKKGKKRLWACLGCKKVFTEGFTPLTEEEKKEKQVLQQKKYYANLKTKPKKLKARKKRENKYYREEIKSDPEKLRKRRAQSAKYARQRRLTNYLEKGGPLFLVFGGDHGSEGGANDLIDTVKSIDSALELVEGLSWWHVYSIVDRSIIRDNEDNKETE